VYIQYIYAMRIEGLEWTDAVREKVEGRHGVALEDVESAVFDRRAHIKKAGRDRYVLLGRSEEGVHLTVIFAYRRRTAHIITARRMDLKERRIYRRSRR